MGIADKLIRLSIRCRVALGRPVHLNTLDRRVLEQRVIPFIASQDGLRRVLFVGTAWYTAHYSKLLPTKEYWTMDPVASRRR